MSSNNNIILTAGLITFTSTVAASVAPTDKGGQGKFPSPRLLFGTGLTFFGLSALGEVKPSIAEPLAWAIAVTAVTYYGMPILQKYMGTDEQPKRK